MSAYKHTQTGTVILVALAAAFLICLGVGMAASKVAFFVAPILAISAGLFYSLTVEVSDEKLSWHFGPGVIRKDVPLNEIASAQIVRTNFIEGWGIHLSRFGWLYNVSGFDAVAITLRNGKKFALGTDEPGELLRALQQKAGPPAG